MAPTAKTMESLEERQVGQQLDEVETRLVDQLAGRAEITEERVRSIVRVVRERFADARIRSFLPILVERAARRELGL
ncbi:MAG TPA: hypothetical protein VK735_40495 [Pseudonocardia sp.]|uniref:three-helix bundle dimerization domain-containing protein n=1 Tax=Pseudonocardia sp. TaxID=60912 RepID=UPI002B572A4A|nr:hypothetical protein [Pseudonocardia sp.]HTF53764.1 hypothetical protein [Pseudonocardia sp.]